MAAMGSSPWLARSGAPLVIQFIILALLQLRDAHRLHSFTSTTQVAALKNEVETLEAEKTRLVGEVGSLRTACAKLEEI